MSEPTDLLIALRDVGVASPAVGDAGDERVRAALRREITGRRRSGPRLRLPFGNRRITLIPAVLLVTAVTAAAAGSVVLVNAATSLFEHTPPGSCCTGVPHQTVIPSTVRKIDTFRVPGVGPVQYWVADTAQHGLCQALRRPDGSWAGYPDHGTGGGQIPGCGPTRAQVVARQGNSDHGLAPTSVDEQSVSMKHRVGPWWDIYFGIVSADDAAGVKDTVSGQTAPLIGGRFFVMVVKQTGNCAGCDNLRAIDAAGHVLPANYGPKQDRDH